MQSPSANAIGSGSELRQDIAQTRNQPVARSLSGNLADLESELAALPIDRLPFAYIVFDKDDRVREWNPIAEKIFGYTRAEILGMIGTNLLLPLPIDDCVREVMSRVRSGDINAHGINENRTKEGRIIVCEWFNTPLSDVDGNFAGAISLVRDVTRQTRDRESLEASERRFQAVFENDLGAILLMDDTGRYFEGNPAACELLGYRREEICHLRLSDIVPPEDRAKLPELLQQFVGKGKSSGVHRLEQKDGRTIEAEFRAAANILPGLHLVLYRDVTESKRAKENLERSESQLAEAQQLARIGSWNWDIPTNTVTWSDELYRIFGLQPRAPEMALYFGTHMVHPEDQAVAQNAMEQALHNHQPYACCLRWRHSDGTYRTIDARGQVIYDEANKPLRVFGTSQDITERRQAEECLRETQERFEQLAANIDGYFWLNSPDDGHMHYMSPGYEKITGKSCESLYQRPDSWSEIIHTEDVERVLEETKNASHETPRQIEYRILKRDGSIRWIRDRAFPVRNAAGEVYRIAGIGEDITEQKTAEEELRALNAALENAVEGIAHTDTQGNYVSVNRAYARMLGYLPDELLSRHWTQTVYHEDIKKVRAAQERLADNQRIEIEARGLRKDGSLFWKQLVMLNARSKHGEWTGNYCFMKDVTERKLSEDVLRAYAQRLRDVSRRVVEIQEAERRYLAQELHDEIGQVLSAISINLQTVAPICDASAQPRLAESIYIVASAIEQVRNLSLDLRPSMLDELGLVATLRWCADRQAQRAGFTLHFSAACSGRRLPTTIETTCYRVAQESLTNVTRHANASEVWITFSENDEQDSVELMIRDDGAGFNPADLNRRAAHGASFGVQGMQERVELVGGEFVIESAPNGGTLIVARIPCASRSLEARTTESTNQVVGPNARGG